MMKQFDNENVLQPKETSWFGYHPDCSFSSVLSTQEVNYYFKISSLAVTMHQIYYLMFLKRRRSFSLKIGLV